MTVSMLTRILKPSLTYRQFIGGKRPGVMFFPGYMSAMTGTKSEALEEWCRINDHSFISFDYRGTGSSPGPIGSLKDWVDDASDIFRLTSGPQILVGSSMGAFMMLHTANKYSDRVKGMVGVAPGFTFVDFIEKVVQSRHLDAPAPPSSLLNDVSEMNLFPNSDSIYKLSCPLHVMHGTNDASIPWELSFNVFNNQFDSNGFSSSFTVCKGKEHRLSTPEDISMLLNIVDYVVNLDVKEQSRKQKL